MEHIRSIPLLRREDEGKFLQHFQEAAEKHHEEVSGAAYVLYGRISKKWPSEELTQIMRVACRHFMLDVQWMRELIEFNHSADAFEDSSVMDFVEVFCSYLFWEAKQVGMPEERCFFGLETLEEAIKVIDHEIALDIPTLNELGCYILLCSKMRRIYRRILEEAVAGANPHLLSAALPENISEGAQIVFRESVESLFSEAVKKSRSEQILLLQPFFGELKQEVIDNAFLYSLDSRSLQLMDLLQEHVSGEALKKGVLLCSEKNLWQEYLRMRRGKHIDPETMLSALLSALQHGFKEMPELLMEGVSDFSPQAMQEEKYEALFLEAVKQSNIKLVRVLSPFLDKFKQGIIDQAFLHTLEHKKQRIFDHIETNLVSEQALKEGVLLCAKQNLWEEYLRIRRDARIDRETKRSALLSAAQHGFNRMTELLMEGMSDLSLDTMRAAEREALRAGHEELAKQINHSWLRIREIHAKSLPQLFLRDDEEQEENPDVYTSRSVPEEITERE